MAMLVERPFAVSSESEDEEEEAMSKLLQRVKSEYDRDLEQVNEFLPCYDSESGSGEDESDESEESEELDAEECAKSRAFIEYLSFNPCITPYELVHLVTAPQTTKRKKKTEQEETSPPLPTGNDLLIVSAEDKIVDEDRHRSVLRIEGFDTYVDVMFENYVHVSYLCNKQGGKYRLALRELACTLLGYGIQYSKNKFTKLTIRYLNGPSHYLFGSGVLVESGTYSEAIAYKTHHHSMRILAERCHHENIAVRKRKCQNIVAKGKLPFGLCLILLKHKYPNLVHYDCDDFAGAIIRPGDMEGDEENRRERRNRRDAKIRRRANRAARRQERDARNAAVPGAGNNVIEDEWDALMEEQESSDDEDVGDSEEEWEHSVTGISDSDDDEEDEDEDDEYDGDDSSYEYFEKFPYEEQTCHPEFDYNAIDKEERRRNEALLQKQEEESQYRVLEKKPLKHKDLLQLHNADDLDDYQVTALTKKKKVTILAFPRGCIICAGCKSNREVYHAYIKVLPMLASCRDTERNKAAQADLIKRGLY